MAQHVIEELGQTERSATVLSIAECRDLLGDEACDLSDDQVDTLRQRAETMAHVLIEIFLESRELRR